MSEEKRYQQNEIAVAKAALKNTMLKAALLLKIKNDELTTTNDLLKTKLTKKDKIMEGRKISSLLLAKNKATGNLIKNQKTTPVKRGGSIK